jgi:signal transduction histidine kinase
VALVTQPEGISVIWPASGIGQAALLLNPRRLWPGILAAIFAINAFSNISTGTTVPVGLGFALANTLEPALCGWLMIRLAGDGVTFSRLRDVLALVLVATFVNALTAVVGAVVAGLGYGTPYLNVWLTWWILDGLSILLVTPPIVAWATGGPVVRQATMLQRVEIGVWAILICLTTWFMFGTPETMFEPSPRPYMLFPILIGMALRLSPRATATTLVLMAAIALGCTATGTGNFPLGGSTPRDRLVAVQAYFCVANATTMMLTSMFTERTLAEGQLRVYRDHLEELVRERTSELQVANEQLQMLSRVKDEFVSNVSHELRTPITSMKLRQRLIRMHPERLSKHLEVIERETDRLHRTVEDLLELSRLDQKRIELALKPVNVNALVSRYTSDRAAVAEERNLRLLFTARDNLPDVKADEGLLEEVLGILVTNAINYTPPAGSITVSTAMQDNNGHRWVGFSVADTGPGIPPEDTPHLFERFFRGKSAGASGASGTGLGLAIAREIVDRHGGKIEVESRGVPGDGTCFRVWLPERT